MVIQRVGIVGTGVMGVGIARYIAAQGIDVVLLKWTPGSLEDVARNIVDGVAKDLKSGRLSAQEDHAIAEHLHWTNAPEELADRDLVIESIVEEQEAKYDCFRRLAAIAKHDAILASNTSTLSLYHLSASVCRSGTGLKRETRFLGLHFFNPVAKMRLVEVGKNAHTAPEAVEAAVDFIRRIGKEPVVVDRSPGLIVNRLLMAQFREAIRAALGEWPAARIQDVDKAMKLGANHPMGPFALMDLIGIGVVAAMARNLDDRGHPHPLLEKMVMRGWTGRKAGIGFYDYRQDPKNPTPNKDLDTLR